MLRILYWYFLFKQTFVPIVRKVEETTDYMIVFYSKKDLFIHSAIWINLEIFVDMCIVRLHNFLFLALQIQFLSVKIVNKHIRLKIFIYL